MIENFNHIEAQPYFNTNFLTPEQWAIENEKATGMQKIIYMVFDLNPNLKISAWQMKRFLEEKTSKYVNINSTRRCLSNLKKENKLVKTRETRTGEEGAQECLYARKSTKNTPTNEYLNKEKLSSGDLAVKLIQKTLF